MRPILSWDTASIAGSAVLITALFWMVIPETLRQHQGGDYRSYYEPVARNVASGSGYTTPGGRLMTRVPPVYPLVLAAVFWISDHVGIEESRLLHGYVLLCCGISSILVFGIARMLWSTLPAMISALLWITCPFVLWLSIQFGSETIYLPTLYATIAFFLHCLIKQHRSGIALFLVGLASGIGALTRPIGIGVGVSLAIVLLLTKSYGELKLRFRHASLIALGSFVILVPWQVAMYRGTGEFILLSSAESASLLHGFTFGIPHSEGALHPTVPDDIERLMHEIRGRSEDANSKLEFLSMVADQFGRMPWAATKLILLKASRPWYGTDSGRLDQYILILQFVYIPVILLSSWRLVRSGRIERMIALTLWAIVIYFWSMTLVITPLLRYMTPPVGLLFVLAPALVTGWKNLRASESISNEPNRRHERDLAGRTT